MCVHMWSVVCLWQVFELLDKDGGGSLDAEELYSVLKDLDINISLEEISSVLQELDKDGNGEIDFDEFLYAMSETDRYLDLLGKGIGPTHYKSACRTWPTKDNTMARCVTGRHVNRATK